MPADQRIGVDLRDEILAALADFGLAVAGFTLDTGFPIVLAVGGLIFLMRDCAALFQPSAFLIASMSRQASRLPIGERSR